MKTKHLYDKYGHITNIGWNHRKHVERTYKAPVPIKCLNCDMAITKANLNEPLRLVCVQKCHLSCSPLHNNLEYSVGAQYKISHTQIGQMQDFANTAVLIIEEAEEHCEYRKLEAELEPVTSMINRRNFRTSFTIPLPAPVMVSESFGLSNDDGDFWIGLPGLITLSLGPSPLSALHGYNEARDIFEKGKLHAPKDMTLSGKLVAVTSLEEETAMMQGGIFEPWCYLLLHDIGTNNLAREIAQCFALDFI